ncbi:DUF1501 domain-containing protein [Flaviaesturariibacter amylovorans]|uniref:DUF1501 domain-containing protein n=1 Tax=Flaviaesturariibacter amylovorans TaxID=1084520 RepID=A0ABP8G9W7_9BACT
MLFKRREFLQVGSLATASLFLPKFLKAFEAPAFVPPGNKVLVVLQLGGGNDGLNTVVPVRNDIYYRSRPKLALAREKTIALTDEAGLHPALPSFADAYHNGNMVLLNGVGYPNPERSHFRSMDIWHSGSHSHQYINTGWVGRYLDAQCNGCARPTQALEFDDTLSLALKGEQMNGLALRDPRSLAGTTNEKFFRDVTQQHIDHHGHEQPADYLYKTLSSTLSGAEYIYKNSKLRGTQASYPNTALGKRFRIIGSLVLSDIDTKVYYVSLSGFDTHINQEVTHARALKEVNDAVDAFLKDMKANGRFDDVLLMTFSEFGRRVAQNASAGTDHGAANNMFLFGGGLKQKGMLNPMSDLTDLDNGDLKYQLDFKQVYATVLKKWLGTDDKAVLGEQFSHLKFI